MKAGIRLDTKIVKHILCLRHLESRCFGAALTGEVTLHLASPVSQALGSPVDAFLGTRGTKPSSLPYDALYGALRGSGHLLVHYRKTVIRLPPYMGRLMTIFMLAHASGHVLSTGDLIEAAWGDDPSGGPEAAPRTIRMHVRHLRELLAPMGLGILCRGWNGYRLVEIAPQIYPRRGRHTGTKDPYAPDPIA